MELLNGYWNVDVNSRLIVDEELVPGTVISLCAGHQLKCTMLDGQQLKDYRLQYFQYIGTNLCVFQQLLRSYSPRKLSLTEWAPLRHWEYRVYDNHATRISGRNILGEEVLSSDIRAVRFDTKTHATVLTYSHRRDVWERIPIWGTENELDGFATYCEQHSISRHPIMDNNFMRHYMPI